MSQPSLRLPFAIAAVVLATALVAATPSVARADDPNGVARVRVLRGDVDLKRADSGDTVAAAINAPMTVGDYLTTHAGARAEIEFDYGTVLRVAPQSQLRFTKLGSSDHVVQLARGTAELRVYRNSGAGASIESPLATLRARGVGRFRATVKSDGSTEIDARSGNADVLTAVGTQTLTSGMSLAISGTAADPDVREVAAFAPDDFDRWSVARDRTVTDSRTSAYLDADLVGASDLERYGRWIDGGRYGRVWSPYETTGWSPYRDGRFVWEPFYGWTWVGLEPWGWAPYHYGNWFYANGPGWCWYPGFATFGNPFVYRPAVVGFISFGGGGFDFGNIGWVPLAPNETFYPWYGGYHPITIVNTITNVTNVTYVNATPQPGQTYTIYHNVNAPGGIVALGRGNFANGHFSRVDIVQPSALAHGVVVRGVLPIVPTSKNLTPTDSLMRRNNDPVASAFAHFEAPMGTVPFAIARSRVRVAARDSFPHESSLAPAAQAVAPTLASPWDRFESRPIVIIDNGATRDRTSSSHTSSDESRAFTTHPYTRVRIDRTQTFDGASTSRGVIVVPQSPSFPRTNEPATIPQHPSLPRSVSPRTIVEPRASTVQQRGDARVIHTTENGRSRSQ